MNENNCLKIFFLFSNNKIEQIAKELLKLHYETYLVNNEDISTDYIKKFNNSILFINIDQYFNQKEWENFIKRTEWNKNLKERRICILIFGKKSELIKNLLKIEIEPNYLELNLKFNDNINLIKNYLKSFRNEIKIISVKCEEDLKFNIRIDCAEAMYINGLVIEISHTGMACHIENKNRFDQFLIVDDFFNNIQLNLKGTLIIISGFLYLKKGNICIFKFKPIIDPYIKDKLNNFIFNQLQETLKQKKMYNKNK